MTEIEQTLRRALAELDGAVKIMAAGGPKTNLLPFFTRIDELAARLPRGTDPELLHFLERRSYEKARLWLEGRSAANARGACRESSVEGRGPKNSQL